MLLQAKRQQIISDIGAIITVTVLRLAISADDSMRQFWACIMSYDLRPKTRSKDLVVNRRNLKSTKGHRCK